MWRRNQRRTNLPSNFFSLSCPVNPLYPLHSFFCFPHSDYFLQDTEGTVYVLLSDEAPGSIGIESILGYLQVWSDGTNPCFCLAQLTILSLMKMQKTCLDHWNIFILFLLNCPIETIFLKGHFQDRKIPTSRCCRNGNLQNCKGDIFDMNI